MAVGVHIIADLYGVDSRLLEKAKEMMKIVEEAVEFAQLTKISSVHYQFEPGGASGVVLIAESHVSFHTWPEYGLVTLDIYTCGSPKNAEKVYEYILAKLCPAKAEVVFVERGKSVQTGKEPDFKEAEEEKRWHMGTDCESGCASE